MHAFDPHDARETSARFRYPCQRNTWVELPDGTRVNSADTEKRGMPPCTPLPAPVDPRTCDS